MPDLITICKKCGHTFRWHYSSHRSVKHCRHPECSCKFFVER